LGRSPVDPVPVALTLDAPRGRRLILQPGFRDAPCAALADAVGALANPLQGALHLLPVLVQEVDQDVAGLAVRQRLREVCLLRNPRDAGADPVVQRPAEAGRS